jgi:AcrR family transcriptional regulator
MSRPIAPKPKKAEQMPERPRRGTADETRERLVETAARVFNEVGYGGTDSNALAKAAGYAPGTFYRHFLDKRAIFLAAYTRWVRIEWDALNQKVDEAGAADLELASQFVKFLVTHHRTWRTFRQSLRALSSTDEQARKFFLHQRKAQLGLVAHLRTRAGSIVRTTEEDLLLLLTLERACDALADDEVAALGGSREKLIKMLLERVQAHLGHGAS